MAAQSRLISGGVNYYIEGGAQYAGTGTPWTVVSTSPYQYAMNETAGGKNYTPRASPRQEVYGGGPPFHDGSQLLYDAYGNVMETITIQCRASTYDNAVALLIQLRQILNTALAGTPCILAFQPNGASNPVYFEIYGADVVEDQRFTNDEAKAAASGHALIRAVVTWRRSPQGGRLSTGETLINAVTFTNNGTGTNNTKAFAAGGGDLINEGSPLNVKWVPGPTFADQLWMASVVERINTSLTSATQTTASTAGVATITTSVSLTNQPYANSTVKGRVLVGFSTLNSITQVRVLVYPNSTAGNPIYTSPWITPLIFGTSTLIDFGAFDMSALRATNFSGNIVNVVIWMRSTTGGTASLNLGDLQVIPYYTWGIVQATTSNFNSETVQVASFKERTNAPAVVISPPIVGSSAGGTNLDKIHLLRGSPPRYYAGASLFLAWLSNSGNYGSTFTAAVTVTHAPQWLTLRGAV